MTVKRRGGKTYHFRFMESGELYYGSTGETAKGAAEEYEREYRRGIRNGTITHSSETPTLEDFSARFLIYVERHQTLKPSTKDFYRRGWRMLARTVIARRPINAIRTPDADTLTFRGGPGNANRALRTLSRMLSYAAELGLIQAKPKIPVREEEGRERLIAPWEEAMLLEHATRTIHDSLVITLDCGMRPDEVSRLQWADINWADNTIQVQRGKTRNARRLVPLTQRMRNVLQGRKARNARLDRAGGRMDSPWVFPTEASRSGHINSSQSRSWNTTLDRANAAQRASGKPDLAPGLVPYSARHTFATSYLASGGDIGQLMRIMGHTNLKTTARYLHLVDAGEAAAVVNRRNDKNAELIEFRRGA